MDSAQEFEYDVFISYSHADESWVENILLPRLEQVGLTVCIDSRDFLAGRAALLNMSDAVKNSRHTVLVLTENWTGSEWTLYEALLIQTKDPAGLQRRTVPVRLEACELPDPIAMLTWVDFTRLDREQIAWNQLLTAVGAQPEPEAKPAPLRQDWHLYHSYAASQHFSGRAGEMAELSRWLESEPAHPQLVLRALGGFGKSALTWHWLLHEVQPRRWPRVVWFSFYETDATFERFLAETLAYLGVDPGQFSGPRQMADALLSLLQGPGILLVLDGFERALRAYASLNAAYQGDDVGDLGAANVRDCVSPVAEDFLRALASLPWFRSKVLMTSRLCPSLLEAQDGTHLPGCREWALTQLAPADAVAFFRARGIRGARAEIEAVCAPVGYHPLSLALLAGLVANDPQQPGDIAAAKKYEAAVAADLKQRQHHVLETAYNNLVSALFPGGEAKLPRKRPGLDAERTGQQLRPQRPAPPCRAVVRAGQRHCRESGQQAQPRHRPGERGWAADDHRGAAGSGGQPAAVHRAKPGDRVCVQRGSRASGFGAGTGVPGAWAEAEQALGRAMGMFEEQDSVQSQSIVAAYQSLRTLLMARTGSLASQVSEGPGLVEARHALELAEEAA